MYKNPSIQKLVVDYGFGFLWAFGFLLTMSRRRDYTKILGAGELHREKFPRYRISSDPVSRRWRRAPAVDLRRGVALKKSLKKNEIKVQ
jgi:hypothetical protein